MVENELKKLETFYSIYFRGKSHFEEDGTQNYSVLQPIQRHFKRIVGVGNDNYVYYWKPEGLSYEKTNSIKTSGYGLTPYVDYYSTNNTWSTHTFSWRNNVYKITDNFNVSSYPTLENSLFGDVKLTKNTDLDKYGYSSCGIGFDRYGFFSHTSGGTGRNVIIFGVDMSSSRKIDNRKKDILILGKGPTSGLDHTLHVEKMYPINFTEKNKTFC